MRTELSYFGTWKDSSRIGTIRYLIVIVPVMLVALGLNKLLVPNAKLVNNVIASVVIAIWLASALGVQNSVNLKNSMVYGGLVFFVVYSVVTTTIWLSNDELKLTELGVPFLAFIGGALCSLLIYFTAPTFDYLK